MRFHLIAGLGLALIAAASTAAELTLRDGYVREMPPGHPVTAAFGHLYHDSEGSIELVAAECACAGRVEIHHQLEQEGRLRMEQVESLTIPADGFELAPGGFHLMLIDLTRPLQAGDEVELTLIDAAGGAHPVQLPVQRMSGVAEPQDHHHHH